MPYNGAGIFQAPSPPNYPAVAGDTIRAEYFNAVIDDLLAGLTTALTRDGQTSPTADLPMAGKKHTGVADAVANNQYATYGQMNTAIAAALPPGAVQAFARSTAPTGWLHANGAAVSRTTYAALFAAIGTTFGTGDGSTTFNLPDLRGEFIRGWDGARGVDPGRAFASAQGDDLRSHSHGASTTAVGDHKHRLAGDADSSDPLLSAGNMAVQKTSGTNSEYRLTNTAAEASLGLSSAAGGHSHGVSVSATGGAETRPRNIALLLCIKV